MSFATSLGGSTDAITKVVSGSKKKKELATPTIDDARKERQETDRIRRRRGVLANVSAGEQGAPAVGTRQLLGA